jgi:hypothetical protein
MLAIPASVDVEWYAAIADKTETTHNNWEPVCSELCGRYRVSPYRRNGEPMAPRVGRPTSELLTSSDLMLEV